MNFDSSIEAADRHMTEAESYFEAARDAIVRKDIRVGDYFLRRANVHRAIARTLWSRSVALATRER